MCLGVTDLPLAQEGWTQAKQMAEALPKVEAVFSSPLRRAVETAQAIGMPLTILEGLRELNMGAWDGLTFEEIRKTYSQLYAQRGDHPELLPPGAERPEQGLWRFRQALEQTLESSSGDVAVVAHAGVIGLFLQDLTGQGRKPGYGEIVPIYWENGLFSAQEE